MKAPRLEEESPSEEAGMSLKMSAEVMLGRGPAELTTFPPPCCFTILLLDPKWVKYFILFLFLQARVLFQTKVNNVKILNMSLLIKGFIKILLFFSQRHFYCLFNCCFNLVRLKYIEKYI